MSNFNPLEAYDLGLRGAYSDPRADELLVDSVLRSGGNPHGGEVAHQWEFAGAGAGKLVATWVNVLEMWPGCWPGPPQETGDCVSWALLRAILMSLTCEILDGRPDEVTGIIEGKPDVSPEGVANCVLSSEAAYWWRGHGSEGWTCAGAANAAMNDSGVWLRKAYPEVGLDLTKYSGDMAQRWGARRPPDTVRQIGRQHLVRTCTVIEEPVQIRDFLWAGFGVYFCSGLKWSGTRDENGYSPVVPGSWAHAQSCIGWDDRPEIIAIYGEPLVCVLNSWGRWNRGPRRVRGTNLDIPEGAYWTKSSAMKRCTCIAVSSVAGWPRRKIKHYGATGRV